MRCGRSPAELYKDFSQSIDPMRCATCHDLMKMSFLSGMFALASHGLMLPTDSELLQQIKQLTHQYDCDHDKPPD